MTELKVTSNIAEHIKEFKDFTAKSLKLMDGIIAMLNDLDKYLSEHNCAKDELSKELVMGFYNSKADKKLSRSYLYKIAKLLRELSIFMQVKGLHAYYLEDPMLPPAKDKAYYIPPRERIAKLVTYLDQQASEAKPIISGSSYSLTAAALIIRVSYLGGTRPGEACSLLVDNIEFENHRIYIPQSKGPKSRYVYLPQGLMELLKRQLAYLRTLHQGKKLIYIFPSSKELNKPFCMGYLSQILKNAWIALFPDSNDNFRPTMHTMRHAYCVHTINRWGAEGIDTNAYMPYLSSQLGHIKVNDTLYYYHQIDASGQAIKKELEEDNEVAKEILNGNF